MTAVTQPAQISTREWVADLLRSFATRLDGGTIPRPTPAEIKREKLRATQLALIDAETEAERATHHVAMLKERINRFLGVAR